METKMCDGMASLVKAVLRGTYCLRTYSSMRTVQKTRHDPGNVENLAVLTQIHSSFATDS